MFFILLKGSRCGGFLACRDRFGGCEMLPSLGYQGLYDFSRDFKKHTGISPSKY
jgi:hypothetical protein